MCYQTFWNQAETLSSERIFQISFHNTASVEHTFGVAVETWHFIGNNLKGDVICRNSGFQKESNDVFENFNREANWQPK